MKIHTVLFLGALFMTAPALADEVDMQAKASHYMEKIDTSNDNMISKTEHDAFGNQMFDEADTNNDNMISLAELTAHKQKEKDEMKGRSTTDE